MADTDTLYTARFRTPTLIERGRDNVVKCSVYRSGALAAPSSGTVSAYDRAGTLVVNAGTVVVSGSEATFTISAATIASLALEMDWRVEWSLAMPDSVTHVFRNDAALVRRALYPSITDADIYDRVSSLDPNGNTPIHSLTTLQGYIDGAWYQIQNRLIAQGNRPYLVMSPSSLRDAHIELVLTLVFEDFSTRLNEAYASAGERHRALFEAAWRRLNFKYDVDDDGIVDAGRKAAAPTLWLGSPISGRW